MLVDASCASQPLSYLETMAKNSKSRSSSSTAGDVQLWRVLIGQIGDMARSDGRQTVHFVDQREILQFAWHEKEGVFLFESFR